MPIEKITADDLRDMEHQEGLVLQGCGGEAWEWLDGINGLLTQDGILQNGSRFETVKVFQHDGLTNLLSPFEDIQVDMGKLAMWRLQTHGAFGGTWLSDYVPNRLGGFRSARQENPRPLCPLLGQDGNIFHLMGIAAEFSGRMAWRQKQRKCRHASWAERATAMQKRWGSSANMWRRSCLRPAKIERKRRRSMSMSDNQKWSILQGDALKVLGTFASNTFDAVITDPPYASGGRTQAEKTNPPSGSIPAWARTHRPLSTGTPRTSAPGPVGRQSGCMRQEGCARVARRFVCSLTGGSSRQPPTPCSGRAGSGAAPLSGIRATAAPRRGASASRRNISSGVPTAICPSAVRSRVCRGCSNTAIRRAASI